MLQRLCRCCEEAEVGEQRRKECYCFGAHVFVLVFVFVLVLVFVLVFVFVCARVSLLVSPALPPCTCDSPSFLCC